MTFESKCKQTRRKICVNKYRLSGYAGMFSFQKLCELHERKSFETTPYLVRNYDGKREFLRSLAIFIQKFCEINVIVEKWEHFFRQMNSLVKTLISRNFWQKVVRLNRTVTLWCCTHSVEIYEFLSHDNFANFFKIFSSKQLTKGGI